MKVSTKGRYGLRAMIELACKEEEGAVPLRVIAEKQGISEQYLEQLFVNLRRNGLVKSVRGAHGGYLLGGSAEEINVGEIIRALEGPVAPAECVIGVNCEHNEGCVARILWEKVRDSINEVLDSMTLKELKQKAKTQNSEGD